MVKETLILFIIICVVIIGAAKLEEKFTYHPPDLTRGIVNNGTTHMINTLCIDGVEYLWWEHGYRGFAVPHLQLDGKPYLCE